MQSVIKSTIDIFLSQNSLEADEIMLFRGTDDDDAEIIFVLSVLLTCIKNRNTNMIFLVTFCLAVLQIFNFILLKILFGARLDIPDNFKICFKV